MDIARKLLWQAAAVAAFALVAITLAWFVDTASAEAVPPMPGDEAVAPCTQQAQPVDAPQGTEQSPNPDACPPAEDEDEGTDGEEEEDTDVDVEGDDGKEEPAGGAPSGTQEPAPQPSAPTEAPAYGSPETLDDEPVPTSTRRPEKAAPADTGDSGLIPALIAGLAATLLGGGWLASTVARRLEGYSQVDPARVGRRSARVIDGGHSGGETTASVNSPTLAMALDDEE